MRGIEAGSNSNRIVLERPFHFSAHGAEQVVYVAQQSGQRWTFAPQFRHSAFFRSQKPSSLHRSHTTMLFIKSTSDWSCFRRHYRCRDQLPRTREHIQPGARRMPPVAVLPEELSAFRDIAAAFAHLVIRERHLEQRSSTMPHGSTTSCLSGWHGRNLGRSKTAAC